MRGNAASPRTTDRRAGDGGFTILELLIALTVLIIGISGILAMQMTGMRASAYSRHATEASVLAEDKMEDLRTAPLATLTGDTETIDDRGVQTLDGLYTRSWTINAATYDTRDYIELTVTVAWKERGAEDHDVTLTTLRVPEAP